MASTFFSQKEEEILQLEARRKIYALVRKYAGCSFHELERVSKIASGTLQYHLNYLTKYGIILGQKDGNKIRYFTRDLSSKDKEILALLRQKSVRKIILYMLHHSKGQQKEISKFTGLSPATISWYVAKLMKSKVLEADKNKGELQFSLAVEKVEIIRLLVAYKESFFDQLVNQTIEMWEFRV